MQPGYMDLAIHHFRKALETDPNFFPAWPALASAYAYKGYYNQMLPADAIRHSQACLEEVARLNPDHLRAHVAWAFHHLFYTWNWTEVVTHLRKAMALQDNDSFIFPNTIFHAAGMYQLISDQHDKAIQTYKKALKMDPLNASIQMEMSRVYLYKREFAKALELNDVIIRNKPDYIQAREARGWILFSMGRQREGIESFEHCRKLSTLPVSGLAGMAYAFARTSQPQQAASTLDLMQSLYQDLPQYAPHYDLALAYLGTQAYKPMFEQLELACEARMPVMIFMEVNPIWDEIRRFNEYRQLVPKIVGEHQRPPL
jgi:tetratricopeptide (TPR) repeat protein